MKDCDWLGAPIKMGKQQKQVIFEDVLKQVGDLGVYQVAIFSFMCGIAFLTVETIYMNFIGYKMDHWCEIPELANFSFATQKRIGIPSDTNASDGSETYERCTMFDRNYSLYSPEELYNLPRPTDAEEISCSSWVYDQSEYTLNIVNEWDLVCGKNWQVDLVPTVSLAATTFGSILGGSISDRYGRVTSLTVGLFIKTISGFWSAFSPNYISFVIARFFVGVASIHCYLVAFVLVMENLGGKHRPWMGIIFSVFFSLGFSVVPLFALACQRRTDLEVIMAAPTLVFLVTVWFLPESPRWLVSKGKFEKAEKGLRLMAAVNNRTLPDDFDVSIIKTEDDKPIRKTSVLDLFKTPKIRLYSIAQFAIWFSLNLIYYALSLNAGSLVGDLYLNTSLLGLVEIPALILCFLAMGTAFFGRRRTLYISALLGGIACLICVPLIEVYDETIAVTVLSMVGKAGATAAYNGMFLLTSEIFPTEVRNVGLGACNMVARASGVIAPYMGGFFGDAWAPLPSLVFGVLGILSGILIAILPETYGKSLPETIAELESGVLSKKPTQKTNSEVLTEKPTLDSDFKPPTTTENGFVQTATPHENIDSKEGHLAEFSSTGVGGHNFYDNMAYESQRL